MLQCMLGWRRGSSRVLLHYLLFTEAKWLLPQKPAANNRFRTAGCGGQATSCHSKNNDSGSSQLSAFHVCGCMWVGMCPVSFTRSEEHWAVFFSPSTPPSRWLGLSLSSSSSRRLGSLPSSEASSDYNHTWKKQRPEWQMASNFVLQHLNSQPGKIYAALKQLVHQSELISKYFDSRYFPSNFQTKKGRILYSCSFSNSRVSLLSLMH